jgi:DNA-binding NarL/FixJ family response regulator
MSAPTPFPEPPPDAQAAEHRDVLLAAVESRQIRMVRKVSPLPIDDAALTAHLADGLTSRQIAKRTGVREHEVNHRVAFVLAQLALHNRPHLVATAIRSGWITWGDAGWIPQAASWPHPDTP